MKKSLFAAAVVALALVSCNKKAEEKVEAVDSAAVETVDSAAAVVDSAATEAVEAAADATKEAADAAKEAVAK